METRNRSQALELVSTQVWALGTKFASSGRATGVLNLGASSPVLFACLRLNLESSFFSQKYICHLLTHRLVIHVAIVAVGFVVFVTLNELQLKLFSVIMSDTVDIGRYNLQRRRPPGGPV